jgi:hypothetical protein
MRHVFTRVEKSKENSACLEVTLESIPNEYEDKYGIQFSAHQLSQFKEFIYTYPLLAHKHEVGDMIYQYIKKHFDSNDYEILTVGSTLYRGRLRKRDQTTFDKNELWNPPIGKSSHGRYNMIGVSVLYCSSAKEGIPYEINPQLNDIIDIATIRTKEDMSIVNLDKLFNGLETYFSQKVSESKALKETYILTSFISDCCREVGFNGIKYFGLGNDQYINYALSNFEQNKDIEICEVKSYEFSVKYEFV